MRRYAVHYHNMPSHANAIDVTRTYQYYEQALAAYDMLSLCAQYCELLECSDGGFVQITPKHVSLFGKAFIIKTRRKTS
jgi:hypothetical protein